MSEDRRERPSSVPAPTASPERGKSLRFEPSAPRRSSAPPTPTPPPQAPPTPAPPSAAPSTQPSFDLDDIWAIPPTPRVPASIVPLAELDLHASFAEPPTDFGHEEIPSLDVFAMPEAPPLRYTDAPMREELSMFLSQDEPQRYSDAPMREEIPLMGDVEELTREPLDDPFREALPPLPGESSMREEIPLFDDDPAVEGDAEAPSGDGSDEAPATTSAALLNSQLLLHEAVANFTRSLVTTMNKSTYYQPGHPAHYAVRDELFGELVRLLTGEAQVGYVLQRSSPPEILVDGAGAKRVALSEIMADGVYQMIVPRFIEYFDRHDLVSLSFRQDLTLQEFGRFIAVWTRPSSHQRDRAPLSDELIAEGIGHVSTVSLAELGLDDTDLPWQVRICLARLRRDLRTIPLFKTLEVESLKRVKNQIFSDVVRPLRDVVQLRMLIEYAPRIEHQLANVDDVRDLDIASSVIHAVQDDRLSTLTLALFPLIDHAEGDELLRLSGVLSGCASSLLSRSSKESFPALRALLTREMVTFEELPSRLREDLTVEKMFAEFQSGSLQHPPTETASDLRLLGRLVELVFGLGQLDEASRLIAPLVEQALQVGENRAVAIEALTQAVPDDTLALMIERFEAEHDEVAREPLANLIQSLGARGTKALLHRIATHPASARFGAAWNLLDRMGDTLATPLTETLLKPETPSGALRVLLALAPRHYASSMGDAILSNARHPIPSVRIAALAALTSVWGTRAGDALESALHDNEVGVVAMALLALVDRAGRPEPARTKSLEILTQANTSVPQELLLAAIQAVCARGGADPDKEVVANALQRIIHPAATNIAFGLGKVYNYDPAVVTAAREAMGRIHAAPSARPSETPSSRPPPKAPSQPPPSTGGAILGRIFRRGT